MPTLSYNLTVTGLEELEKSFSKETINQQLVKGLGMVALDLHKQLKSEISKEYNFNKPLDSVFKGIKTVNHTLYIESTIEYTYAFVNLSIFNPKWYWGNINAGATRPGRVHTVEIKKNSRKIVYGKDHRGGFIPRGKNGLTKARQQMYERKSRNKTPLRLLFGPSLSMTAKKILEEDNKIKPNFTILQDAISSI